MNYTYPYHLFDLFAVYRLERAKTFNIERLEDIKQMGRHIEGDDIVVFAIELEVGRMVVIVAIEDEETMNPNYSSFGMFVEVLNPF